MNRPSSPLLTGEQLERLKELGEERTADPDEVLFDIGDERYPFIAILAGEAAILDAAGNEIIRHGAAGFLGEMNLLSGQTVFLRAVATEPMRYIAVERERLKELLFEDSAFSELVLSAFIRRREALQAQAGVGLEVVGDAADPKTLEIVGFAKRLRVPFTRIDPGPDETDELPFVRLPGGAVLARPTSGELSRGLGIGLELAPEEEVDLLVIGGGPAGLGAAVYGSSEGLETLMIESAGLGGQAGTSRRIENYLGFPGGISGVELTSRAITQARKFGARTASPYRATRLEPDGERHLVELDDGDVSIRARAVVIATGAEYRRLPVENLADYEGRSVFYAAGPPEAQLCRESSVAVVGGGNSAAQAAIWLVKGGADVTLLHRRADLTETMSDYLIRDLDRFGVKVRDRSEIAELHGTDGTLEAVTLRDGERLGFSYLFLFLGAEPCTGWLGDAVARDDDGFILTGEEAGVEGLMQTSVPGVFAAGDTRSGSVKRCATAVGEGATAVQLVHRYLNA